MSVAETHWSFVPLKKPEVPKVGSPEVANTVDTFIAAKLESEGLEFNKLADKQNFDSPPNVRSDRIASNTMKYRPFSMTLLQMLTPSSSNDCWRRLPMVRDGRVTG